MNITFDLTFFLKYVLNKEDNKLKNTIFINQLIIINNSLNNFR